LLAAAAFAATFALTAPALATPGPQNAPEYWFDTWQIPALWSQGADGHGVVIGEIDTGVNASLPELQGKVLSGIDYGSGGNGQIDRQENSFGHGTAMASIMVGSTGVLGIEGIAPAAKILPIAVPLSGTTDASGNDHLADAIRFAADHHAKIINMSLGGARLPERDTLPCPQDEQDAIYYAMAKGSVVIAAAGNTGPSSNTVEEPGVCLGVVSVGAVDITGTVANFSARHPYLTLTAPGVNVPSLSRTPGAAYAGDGTSQATAITSAVFALVWSHHPTLTARQVTARVLATLDDPHQPNDPAYGYGLLDGYRAATAPVSSTAPNPVFAAADPFLARYVAFSRAGQPKPPKPAAAGTEQLGAFRVGHSPRVFVPRVLNGIYLAVAGLVGLLVVLVVLRRRRPEPPSPPTEEAPELPPPPGSPDAPDSEPVVWHEILDLSGDGTG
jgi:subtilisin family serine protease